jgi:ACS family sodium-dependent inorganic phosphate cotransporter
MSVAIIPMSHQLGWSSTTAGLVQSSFFWGYCLSQLPGGWLAKAFSGQMVLRAGVLMWSLATAAVPSTAKILPLLLLCRLLVGLGEGVSPAAATDLIARAMPLSERSRAVATVFGGLNVGSVVGLLLAPIMIERFGWESVFYAFGALGIIWFLLFESAVGSSMLGSKPTNSEPPSTTLNSSESGGGNGSISIHNGHLLQRQLQSAVASNGTPPLPPQVSTSPDKRIPWKAFAKSPAVWAMIYAHFCGNWGHYTLLSWLPTYFR